MPRAVHWVPSGSASPIASFFSRIIGCPSQVEDEVESSAIGLPRCVIPFETGQELIFQEVEGSSSDDNNSGLAGGSSSPDGVPKASVDAYDTDESRAYHLALYLGSDEYFERAFLAAEAEHLLYANPRFEGGRPEFSNAMTWEDARASRQFRVKDLRGPSPGQGCQGKLGLVLELEVRAPTHISYPKCTKD
jgi:hypothetical protein